MPNFNFDYNRLSPEGKQAFDTTYNALIDQVGNPTAWGGQLPQNPILQNLFNKISTQYIFDGFKYELPILDRYLRASSFAGGIDEILSPGEAKYQLFEELADPVHQQYIPEQYSVQAFPLPVDQYVVSIPQLQVPQAFLSASTFGSFVGMIMKRIQDTRIRIWRQRLIDWYKKYPVVIPLKSSIDEPEKIYKEITGWMLQMTQPSTAFNIYGKVNATPFEEQQITWNSRYLNEGQWITARLFNQNNIFNINKLIISNFLDFGDDSIVAVLDTQDTLYIGQKQQTFTYQWFGVRNTTDFFRTEIYTMAYVTFANGVLFKLDGNPAPDVKKPLEEAIKDTNVTAPDLELQTLKDAIQKANEGFIFTTNEALTVTRQWMVGTTRKASARVNSLPASQYTGLVNVEITIGKPSLSNNRGK